MTLGERGLIWYDEAGTVRSLPALAVPSNRVLDTSGAGDVFHGAYIYSYLANPTKSWQEHFQFGRAAAAYEIQHLGNEAGLPTLADVVTAEREFADNNLCISSTGDVQKGSKLRHRLMTASRQLRRKPTFDYAALSDTADH